MVKTKSLKTSNQRPKPYKRNWKKLVLTYLMIGAFLYGGISLLTSSKKEKIPYSAKNTAQTIYPNWNTYEKFNTFRIEYPPSWIVNEESLNNYSTFEGAANERAAHFRIASREYEDWPRVENYKSYYDHAIALQDVLGIEIWLTNDVSITLDEWLKIAQGSENDPKYELIPAQIGQPDKIEHIIIDGKPAKKLYYNGMVTYTPYGPRGREITVIYADKSKAAVFTTFQDSKLIKEFDKIISTFKFTK